MARPPLMLLPAATRGIRSPAHRHHTYPLDFCIDPPMDKGLGNVERSRQSLSWFEEALSQGDRRLPHRRDQAGPFESLLAESTSPAIHRTMVTTATERASNTMGFPSQRPRMSQKTAGGQGALHSMDEWGMNGVKNRAMENALSKVLTHALLTRLDSHHVTPTTTAPRAIQIQGIRITLIIHRCGLICPSGLLCSRLHRSLPSPWLDPYSANRQGRHPSSAALWHHHKVPLPGRSSIHGME